MWAAPRLPEDLAARLVAELVRVGPEAVFQRVSAASVSRWFRALAGEAAARAVVKRGGLSRVVKTTDTAAATPRVMHLCWNSSARWPTKAELEAVQILSLRLTPKTRLRAASFAECDALERVFVSGCPTLEEIPVLPGNLRLVSIAQCERLRDVSGLQNVAVTDLEIVGCPDLRSLPALRRVRRMTLRKCPWLEGLPLCREAVYEATVCECPAIRDVCRLARAHVVTLDTLPGVTDLAPLENVDTLHLRNLPGVVDLRPLRRVRVLTLNQLWRVEDASGLDHLRSFSVSACPRLARLPRCAC